MPVILLERLPLPSLKTYTVLSVGLLASALYYAHSSLENDDSANVAVFELLDMYSINMSSLTGSVIEKACLMAYVLAREPWCLVVSSYVNLSSYMKDRKNKTTYRKKCS